MLKRLMLMLLVLALPAAARAQGSTVPGHKDVSNDNANAAQPQPLQPVPVSDEREGSVVGYIDDSLITTRIRVRWESGFHNHVPDRSEFFYAKCGCYSGLPASNAAFDAAAPGPKPGVVTDLNFQQLYLEGEYAAGKRVGVFAELPIRWIQPQTFAGGGTGFGNQSGIGDLRAGVKVGLANNTNTTATFQLRGYFDTGKAENGLGTNHSTLEPALLMNNALGNRAAIESQIGYWLPLDGSKPLPNTPGDKFSGPVFYYGIGPSYEVYRSRGGLGLAPVVELIGWHVISGSQTLDIPPGATQTPKGEIPDASGTNIVNLKIGARVSWHGGGSVYVGWGHALTDTSWYDDIVRFEFRKLF
jgi:hypothetical protein